MRYTGPRIRKTTRWSPASTARGVSSSPSTKNDTREHMTPKSGFSASSSPYRVKIGFPADETMNVCFFRRRHRGASLSSLRCAGTPNLRGSRSESSAWLRPADDTANPPTAPSPLPPALRCKIEHESAYRRRGRHTYHLGLHYPSRGTRGMNWEHINHLSTRDFARTSDWSPSLRGGILGNPRRRWDGRMTSPPRSCLALSPPSK